jgi:hypothetical protein
VSRKPPHVDPARLPARPTRWDRLIAWWWRHGLRSAR